MWCGAVLLGSALAAQAQPAASAPQRSVTLVLAGGGAKGFAHLAVLRRLEQDHIKISKIVGTSMGAVVGGLYASGMSTQQIEQTIGNSDPAKVALDYVERQDLPHRTRAYQQQYPVDIELGFKNGRVSFARGVSDGQRMLTLLQELTAHVPPNSSFDALKIPFRAVATRYRDGELVAFDRGSLPLAIRASMAAPAVFAPVEIDGETYVDGGLVANLPIEVALREGADIIVASYLGDDAPAEGRDASNALEVANQMLTILMRQNERRNIGLLREGDILVRPQLQGFRFGDFNKATEIIAVGQQAVAAQEAQFAALASTVGRAELGPDKQPVSFTRREITVTKITVTGNADVPADYIERALSPLLGREYDPNQVAQQLDSLYTSGYFERLTYQLAQISGGRYALEVDVNEKPYGPHFFKTNLGFFSESGGVNMFSVGLGYRRPWLTAGGLEVQADLRVGSQNLLSASLFQPFADGWGLGAFAAYKSSELPLYRPDLATPERMANATVRRQEMGVDLTYDFNNRYTARIGLSTNFSSIQVDTANHVSFVSSDGQVTSYHLENASERFTGLNLELTADLLDSPSFPTKGYYINFLTSRIERSGSPYANYRFSALWAKSLGVHSLNLGIDVAADQVFECEGCQGGAPIAPLFLGGFQTMGAYRFGQLNGDRLLHVQATYMLRLLDGGLSRQPTYVGLVAEKGDAWMHNQSMSHNYSGTLFIAVDSKIGDVFFGIANGSAGNRNVFVQLGRRFTVW
jgi:NTE family protein